MATTLPATVVIVYNVVSQNVRERWHWSKQRREVTMLTNLLTFSTRLLPRATGHRWVSIKAYRKVRIADRANLVGGCKSLCDAIVRCGVVKDDKDALATFAYDQAVLSQLPPDLVRLWQRRPLTVITVSDQAPVPA